MGKMDKADSQLSPVSRKAVKLVEEKFPEVSKKICSCREGKYCGITGGQCEFESCPKIREKIGGRSK